MPLSSFHEMETPGALIAYAVITTVKAINNYKEIILIILFVMDLLIKRLLFQR